MSAWGPRLSAWLTLSALGAVGCVGGYAVHPGVRSAYQSPEPEPAASATPSLVSAHISRYGVKPAPLMSATEPRMVEGDERSLDRLLLVFSEEIDPLTLDPRAFGILRADGRRVRPVRAFLAPADEHDENRSVTLLGNFSNFGGSEQAPPVAVHVLGTLYAESGANLHGLDADITGPSVPDRPVIVERLAPNPSRCPGAAQVIRTYWSDSLTHVGASDLAGVDLRLADGRVIHPVEFDDQARREQDPPCAEAPSACLGPADDNVLDLCLDHAEAVVHLRFAAGLFRDAEGNPSAAADIPLPLTPTEPR